MISRRRKTITFLFVIILSLVIWLVVINNLLWGGFIAPTPTPLIILKLPRSGSSWLTEKLNEIPSVYISKEIIQRSDRDRFSTQEMEDHLIRALRYPMGKLSDTRRILPSGRYFEDFLFHKTLKVFRSLNVIGFTVNPEHCKFINWDKVITSTSNVKIVVLRRRNVIKSAISGHLGQKMKYHCGVSNLKAIGTIKKILRLSSQESVCDVPDIVEWSAQDFVKHVSRWRQRYSEFDQFVNRLINLDISHSFSPDIHESRPTRLRWAETYYESLQQDLRSEIMRVFREISLDTSIVSFLGFDTNGGWKKRTSDDLQSILLHFKTINHSLATNGCTCLQHQLITNTSISVSSSPILHECRLEPVESCL